MNLDAVGLRIALIYYFTILVLKYPLSEASQSMHHSANNKIADAMVGGEDYLTPLYRSSLFSFDTIGRGETK
jgi:hypothetical protein